jgi:putative ABC transport system substrate-binding protein
MVGFIRPSTQDVSQGLVAALRVGLNDQGFVAERNFVFAYGWAPNRYDELRALAGDLVQRNVAVLVASGGTVVARACIAASTTVPIVFHVGSDPVAAGLVTALSRPGGNATGVTIQSNELMPKRIEILRNTVPNLKLVNLLINPANPTAFEPEIRQARQAAELLGLNLLILDGGTVGKVEAAFTTVAEQRTGAMVISADPLFTDQPAYLANVAARYRVPAIYHVRDIVDSGGLVSYGASFAASHRLLGNYAGRILKGEKPSDLPVQQSSKVELVVNIKTAKALGLTVPPSVLTFADEVIE